MCVYVAGWWWGVVCVCVCWEIEIRWKTFLTVELFNKEEVEHVEFPTHFSYL